VVFEICERTNRHADRNTPLASGREVTNYWRLVASSAWHIIRCQSQCHALLSVMRDGHSTATSSIETDYFTHVVAL